MDFICEGPVGGSQGEEDTFSNRECELKQRCKRQKKEIVNINSYGGHDTEPWLNGQCNIELKCEEYKVRGRDKMGSVCLSLGKAQILLEFRVLFY